MPPLGVTTLLRRGVADALVEIDRPPGLDVGDSETDLDLDAPLLSGADDNAHVFQGADDSGHWWWLPVPQLDPDGFRFQYRKTGADAAAVPTIAATVTVKMRWVQPDELASTVMPAGATLHQIVPLAVDATLAVPFIDASSNQLTFAQLPMATAYDDSTLTCTVEIASAIARAVYGSLSVAGFQSQPSAITVLSHFAGIVRGRLIPAPVRPRLGESGLAIPDIEFLVPVNGDDGEGGGDPEPIIAAGPVRRAVIESGPEHELREGGAGELHVGAGELRAARPDLTREIAEVRVPLAATMMSREEMFTRRLTPITSLQAGEEETFVTGPRFRLVEPLHTIVNAASVSQRSSPVPVLVPCRERPDQFREDPGDGSEPKAVGCQDPSELGKAPSQRFVELPDFAREGRYRVWESQQQVATYVVAPIRYRVTRVPASAAEPEPGARPPGSPVMLWTEVFDATRDDGLPCALFAHCVPDLTPAELADLGERLRARVGRKATLLVPTSAAAGAQGVTVTATTLTGGTPQVVMDGAELAVAMRVSYSDAVVVAEQLRGGEAIVGVKFEMGDERIRMTATAHLDVSELSGPWPAGPVSVVPDPAGARLTNAADSAATVTAVWTATSVGGWSRAPLDAPLVIAPGETGVLPPTILVGADTVPEATFATSAQELQVRSVFLEDLHTVVLLRRDVDLAAKDIQRLDLEMSISGIAQATVRFPAALDRLEVTLVQPLSAARSALDRNLSIAPTTVSTDGTATVRPSVAIDLSKGVIVPLSAVLG